MKFFYNSWSSLLSDFSLDLFSYYPILSLYICVKNPPALPFNNSNESSSSNPELYISTYIYYYITTMTSYIILDYTLIFSSLLRNHISNQFQELHLESQYTTQQFTINKSFVGIKFHPVEYSSFELSFVSSTGSSSRYFFHLSWSKISSMSSGKVLRINKWEGRTVCQSRW